MSHSKREEYWSEDQGKWRFAIAMVECGECTDQRNVELFSCIEGSFEISNDELMDTICPLENFL